MSPLTTSQFGYLTVSIPKTIRKTVLAPGYCSRGASPAGLKVPHLIFTGRFGLQDKSSGTTLKACLNLDICWST